MKEIVQQCCYHGTTKLLGMLLFVMWSLLWFRVIGTAARQCSIIYRKRNCWVAVCAGGGPPLVAGRKKRARIGEPINHQLLLHAYHIQIINMTHYHTIMCSVLAAGPTFRSTPIHDSSAPPAFSIQNLDRNRKIQNIRLLLVC